MDLLSSTIIYLFSNPLFFSSQIETIDDPVPAVEAILGRCNKHQVNITGISPVYKFSLFYLFSQPY